MFRAILIAAALAAGAAQAQDAAMGEKVFARCKACHEIASPEGPVVRGGRTGPNLYGVIGRTAGTADFPRYGDSLKAAGEKGLVWSEETLAAYVQDPTAFLKDYLNDNGARSMMTFKLPRGGADVAAFLATHGG